MYALWTLILYKCKLFHLYFEQLSQRLFHTRPTDEHFTVETRRDICMNYCYYYFAIFSLVHFNLFVQTFSLLLYYIVYNVVQQ